MRMTFKRGCITGILAMAAVMGVYLTFFNHPPAAITLEANAHNSAQKMRPPKFSDDFGPPKSNPADGSRQILSQKDDTAKEKILRDQGTQHKDEVPSKAPSLENDLHENNTTESVFFNLINDTEAFDKNKQEEKPQNKQDPQISAKKTKTSENSGEVKEDAKDEVKEIAKTGEEGGADTKPGVDGGSKVISHYDYPRFDWDKWVKDNDLVGVGTIWGYCDDPEPPEIGKLLLMKDEDRGGLKVVIVMNSTFDEQVESGQIFANVMYGDMSFYDNTMDICTLFDDDELEPGEERDNFFDCPMAAGPKYYTKELHIPFFVPSGHFTAKAKLVDQLQRPVICTSAELKL
ncbi:uncharacterized protein LOC119746137 [Patiria miniata]|uniref:MD-2-related lipid-recognition domain-containing protein n=1 Tax=Patiria miniata TaxID=46514 RepID=A0A914BTH6_PATMI|nr:uncharacterized protein LOC119746137 [Patiria miniata]